MQQPAKPTEGNLGSVLEGTRGNDHTSELSPSRAQGLECCYSWIISGWLKTACGGPSSSLFAGSGGQASNMKMQVLL